LQPLPRLTQELFDKLNEQVLYEIEVLFPYVRKIVYAHNNNEADGRLLLKSLRKLSASDRTKYHNSLENLTAEIAFITNDFQPQENACTTQKVMLQKLQEFIGYVGQYITIEKKILIPATLQIEINLLESCVEL
jgi:iron-sulfur cluster repair protein YtfE (RIC family)